MRELRAVLARLAEEPALLVASDYDGTLSPIVDDPERAFPQPGAIEALEALAALPSTQVAILSGRSLEDLGRLGGMAEAVLMVGGHGAERSPASPLPAERRALLKRVQAELQQIAGRFAGAALEAKPTSIAFHYRHVQEDRVDELLRAVAEGPGCHPEVFVRHGKKVVELAVVKADKGTALEALRAESGAPVVVYLGDDVTDEDAFALLGEGDVAIKVGEGETAAPYRLGDPEAVVGFLEALVAARKSR
ncbi:MAG: trehalose-phosphatase [Actinomycetota bacterium]|nr:trehalose-phosphatase [Actinomycetota bacterium]